nr:MAG TPA: hypothetical protein [Caudoviricetes sp.]
MQLCVDPLEGVFDAKLLIRGLELLAAHRLPLAAVGGFEADIVHTVVIKDDLHATVVVGDLICLIERLLVLDALELDGIIESLNHGVSLPRG